MTIANKEVKFNSKLYHYIYHYMTLELDWKFQISYFKSLKNFSVLKQNLEN